jgi:hypothetical protein
MPGWLLPKSRNAYAGFPPDPSQKEYHNLFSAGNNLVEYENHPYRLLSGPPAEIGFWSALSAVVLHHISKEMLLKPGTETALKRDQLFEDVPPLNVKNPSELYIGNVGPDAPCFTP